MGTLNNRLVWYFGAMPAPLNSVEGFAYRFAGEIRVAFNWHRFESARWPVERIEVRSPDHLAALEAPMCLDPDGTHADCRTTAPDE